MSFSVFFSWQSDRGSAEQELIEQALSDALARIVSDAAVEPAIREKGLKLDSDTRGVGGMPPVVDTILKKIDEAAIFVPDLTFVATRVAGSLAPNPNVLIEYGWALNSLGHGRILPVMNTHYGLPTPTDMPFDMRHLLFPSGFNLPPNATPSEVSDIRASLSRTLEEKLRLIIAENDFIASDNSETPFPTRDARLQFRISGPVGKTYGDFINRPVDVRLKDGPAFWLNLRPAKDTGRRWSTTELKRLTTTPNVQLFPLAAFGSQVSLGFLRGEDGFGVYVPIEKNEPTPTLVYVFDTGEIWGIDCFHALTNGAIHLPVEYFAAALDQYRAFMKDKLNIEPPYVCEAGIDRVKNEMVCPPRKGGLGRAGNPTGACITNEVTYRSVVEDASVSRSVLRGFFERVLERCGVEEFELDD